MKSFFLFLFGVRMIINIVNQSTQIPYIIFAILNHIFFMGLVVLLFQEDMEKKILAASIMITVETMVMDFCCSFFSCLAYVVKKLQEPFLGMYGDVLITYLGLAMEILVIHCLSKYFHSVFHGKIRKWYTAVAVPLLVLTTVIDVADWGASNGIMVRGGENWNLYYAQLFSYGEICVLTGLSMFAAGCYVFGMDRIYLEQRKSGQYHSQIMAYKMLEEQYRQSERLRHDMKNHIIALRALLQNKEWAKMRNYLADMEDQGNIGIGEEVTGNRVIDALLYRKRKLAEEKDIIWECDVRMPKECCIDEFDLCVLFGNILDNAIEACERLSCSLLHNDESPFVNIQSKIIKKCLLLEIKNSTDLKDMSEIGFTRKNNPEEHGIGLLNISDIVRRYNGSMKIEMIKGVFIISILLPLNDNVHDTKQAV